MAQCHIEEQKAVPSSLWGGKVSVNLMGFVLNGVMRGMRVVGNPEGTDGEGKHWAAGEKWRFLSMEVVDPRYGGVYSCQLSDRDPQFGRLYDGKVLKEDYTGHNVK